MNPEISDQAPPPESFDTSKFTNSSGQTLKSHHDEEDRNRADEIAAAEESVRSLFEQQALSFNNLVDPESREIHKCVLDIGIGAALSELGVFYITYGNNCVRIANQQERGVRFCGSGRVIVDAVELFPAWPTSHRALRDRMTNSALIAGPFIMVSMVRLICELEVKLSHLRNSPEEASYWSECARTIDALLPKIATEMSYKNQ